MKLFRFLSFLYFLLSIPPTLSSHPHIFIHAEIEIKFDTNGLAGVQVVWTMDDMISTGLIFDYDKNFDSTFDIQETAVLRNEFFGGLREARYYTFISSGDKECTLDKLDSFKASIKNFKVQYSYFVPCRVELNPPKGNIQISLYDPTFYNYIEVPQQNVRISAGSMIQYKINSYKHPNIDFYKKQFIPRQFDITFEKK